MDRQKAKKDIIEICKRLYRKGWVANHEGNISLKIEQNEILITPTALSKIDITEDMLIVVDMEGNKVQGERNPFSELPIHLACYRSRDDIKSVIHSHCPYATSFSIRNQELEYPTIHEFVVSIGDKLPLVQYSQINIKESIELIAQSIIEVNAILLSGNGVLTVGKDLLQAFYRMEHVEHYCMINHLAQNLSREIRYIPPQEVVSLLEKRQEAGIAPPNYKENMQPIKDSHVDEKIKRIIVEEVKRVLDE